MGKDVFSFIVGGKAGEGVRKAGTVAANLFANVGRYAFQMDDYQSLITGGHNFSAVSTATREITSHYMEADVVVALDKKSYELHKGHLASGGTLVYNSDALGDGDWEGIGIALTSEARKYPNPSLRLGLGAVAILAAAIDFDTENLQSLIEREYPKDTQNNIAYAMVICDMARKLIGGKYHLEKGNREMVLLSGNEAIALGACAAGLDIYFSYPMTPTTSILHYLAAHDEDLGIAVVHPENEIAVINMAIGAAFSGARVMVGSSGGGFALMEEAFSLAGMSEAPVLCVLASRLGPSIGAATYTEQGDLRFAINQGHGEFPRIVASPGTVQETFFLAAEMMNLVWRFQTPGILLTEKHMSESRMTVDINPEGAKWIEPLIHKGVGYSRYLDTSSGVSPLLFPPSQELIKWNSHEHDEMGITSERPEIITKMHDKRKRKGEAIVDYMKGMHTVNIYGDKGLLIFTYGSTTMSVLEALKVGGIDAMVVQPIYVEPLPVWELERYEGSKPVVVEQSSTGLFAALLKEKAGIDVGTVIKKYDGRPFDPIELADKLREAV